MPSTDQNILSKIHTQGNKMADSASELESDMQSDTSSMDGGGPSMKLMPLAQLEQLQKKIEYLQQQNTFLASELETTKQRCRNLQEENRELRKASVNIQARAEQEEEFISNTLLKKIQALKKEKETLAVNFEKEEECLTNDLSKKLVQLRNEKFDLEQTLEKEQEYQVNKLKRKIDKLEAETIEKQRSLEQLRREKVELENSLEQEQEALVNRLWKRMDKLEAEKRLLQEKLDQPISNPPSPRDMNNGDTAANLALHIQGLRGEVSKLKNMLAAAKTEHTETMAHYAQEEERIKEENRRLHQKLQMEMDKRETLSRHLSESESSLEMDDERHFNEMCKQQDKVAPVPMNQGQSRGQGHSNVRPRTASSPIPVQLGSTRPISPGLHYGSSAFSPPSPMRAGGFPMQQHPVHVPNSMPTYLHGNSPPLVGFGAGNHAPKPRASGDKFVKPSVPPPSSPVGHSAMAISPQSHFPIPDKSPDASQNKS